MAGRTGARGPARATDMPSQASRGDEPSSDAVVGTPGGARRRRSWQRTLGLALAWLLVWLSRLELSWPPAPAELDPSWQQALGRALVEGRQHGVDLWFTFGPLGWFDHPRHEPALFWTHLWVWQILFRGLVASVFLLCALRWTGLLDRALFLGLLVLLPMGLDAFHLATIAAIAALLLERPRTPLALQAVGLALLAAIALVKFHYLPAASVAALALVVAGARAGGARRAIAVAALALGSFLAVWTLAGQRPWHLPAFLARGARIAAAYSEAQAREGPFAQVELALALGAVLAACALLAAWASRRRAERALAAAVLAAAAFSAFKGGFVDHGTSVVTWFGFAAVAPFLVFPGDADRASRPRLAALAPRALALARAGCAAAGFLAIALPLGDPTRVLSQWVGTWAGQALHHGPAALLHARAFGELRDRQLAARRAELDLPLVREQVGAGGVDQLGSAQALLLHNGLAWSPRPVFQSYLTSTAELARANARFLAGERAPGHVLYALETTDRRLPGSEDGLAQQVLWRDYAPVLVERGHALLRRREDAPRAEAPREVVLDREVALRDPIDLADLPGECLVLSLAIEETVLGRVRRALFRAPVLEIEVDLAGGQSARYRLVPGMVEAGVVVRPFPLTTEQALALWDGRAAALPRVERARIVASDKADLAYRARVRVRVERADGLLPHGGPWPLSAEQARVVEPAPRELASPFAPSLVSAGGGRALLVHAPSDLALEVAPGKHRLTGRYGSIAPRAGDAPSDGVVFGAVLLEEGREPRALWHATVDGPGAARGAQGSLDVELEVQRPARLHLRTTAGPARDARSDRAWWSEVRLDRVQG